MALAGWGARDVDLGDISGSGLFDREIPVTTTLLTIIAFAVSSWCFLVCWSCLIAGARSDVDEVPDRPVDVRRNRVRFADRRAWPENILN